MNLKQALEWADKNSSAEVVERLRSRKVVSVLAAEVRLLTEAVEKLGEMADCCTYPTTRKVCGNCQCMRSVLK